MSNGYQKERVFDRSERIFHIGNEHSQLNLRKQLAKKTACEWRGNEKENIVRVLPHFLHSLPPPPLLLLFQFLGDQQQTGIVEQQNQYQKILPLLESERLDLLGSKKWERAPEIEGERRSQK